MSTYVVTGGCGFIGSHLVDELIARGSRVIAIDDLSTGKLDNLNEQAEFVEGSVLDTALMKSVLQGASGCFHLAAVASVERSSRQWLECHNINVGGTVSVLEAIREVMGNRPIPMVYASSAATYGNCETVPITENVERSPTSAYGADKLASELHAKVAGHNFGIPSMGMRFFNVYGPRQDPSSPYSGVISIFEQRIRERQAITIFGDGKQTRDFVYVKDVVRCLITGMREVSANAPVVNVCSGNKTSIKEVALCLARLYGHALKVNYEQARAGDIKDSLGDPTQLNERLGVRCETGLGQGLALMLSENHSSTNKIAV